VLLDGWLPGGRRLDREEALAELARRYLAGHGPAGVADLLTWSGLPAADGRTAFELIAGEIERTGPELSVLSKADPGKDIPGA
jgi:hypothetical protein